MTPVERFAADYFVLNGLTADRQTYVLRELTNLAAHAGVPAEQVDAGQLRAYMAEQLSAGLHVNTVRKQPERDQAVLPLVLARAGSSTPTGGCASSDVKPPRGRRASGRPRPYKLAEILRFWGRARRPLAGRSPENILAATCAARRPTGASGSTRCTCRRRRSCRWRCSAGCAARRSGSPTSTRSTPTTSSSS
jgi:hypothetical protein